MNVRLYDGTVRCAEHFDASSYESETPDPCLYCPLPSPETTHADEDWLNALSTLVIAPPRRVVQLAKVQCGRCPAPATWKIIDELSGAEYTCTDHGQEWYPDLFPEFSTTCGTCKSVTPTPGPWNVHATWCDDCVSHGRHLTSH